MSTQLTYLVPLTAVLAMIGLAAEETATPGSQLLDSTSGLGDFLGSVRWGAYGEAHYNNFQGGASDDKADLHRMVLLAEAPLAQDWRFVGEIEFEHSLIGEGKPGEIEVEQAFIEWSFHERHRVRGGTLLVPISIGNLHHEPTVFHGVERSLFDTRIVPTTWFDIGIGVTGDLVEGLAYELAVQTGLQGQKLAAGNGVRSGRQKGSEASAEDLMGTARLDYRPLPALWLAAAVNYGGIDQLNDVEAETTGQDDAVTLLMYVLEARWADFGVEAGVSFAEGRISDPEELTPTGLPEAFRGLSVFLAYDLLFPLDLGRRDRFFVFARFEDIDNNARMPAGVAKDQALNTQAIQYGVTWQPNSHVVVKLDYQDIENDDESGIDSWNLGVGFAF